MKLLMRHKRTISSMMMTLKIHPKWPKGHAGALNYKGFYF